MTKCDATLKIEDNRITITIPCVLEEGHKGKHKFEATSKGKLFKIEWWDKLPIIEGLTDMYVKDGML